MYAGVHHLDRELKIMTKPKKIVVWGSEDILSAYIEYFLAAKDDWNVVSISNHEAQESLMSAVDSMQPDFVIINQPCNADLTDLPLKLLQDHPAIKVITIGLENNVMDVYSLQQVFVKQAADLIKVIDNEQ